MKSVIEYVFALRRAVVSFAFVVVFFAVSLTVGQDAQKPVEEPATVPSKLILVVGAPGTDEYEAQFQQWAQRWQGLAKTTDQFSLVTVSKEFEQASPYELLKEAIETTDPATESLWIVMIGHGTDDRKRSKFNLNGPDVSASELKGWLDLVECPTVIVNCASCSGGFLSKLKSIDGPPRVVVSSGKSGAQYFFARFGDYFSKAISDQSVDLDKDEQTSLLEAFIAASQQTQDFYKDEKRLATELALIDDNGDGLGTPGDWFAGTRVTRKSKSGEVDGKVASKIVLVRRGSEAKFSPQQRQKRDELEAEVDTLRLKKNELEENAYFEQMESLMLKLGKLYADVEKD